ncbi:T9SS type A sorting domain-containing protein [Mangrovimonas aestuarii]|uniref:T9SS type A sorting domain-containing protein n=1 Tax=Mangrovimonas aestuarii TaxID=3018443 RepID=UPI002378E440|nr:T9SS type A sorting domain-containing protein [Mangrovimonas aestuarii]
MKRTLLSFAAICLGLVALAQEITVDLSMTPSYANQVYYKLSTQTANSYAANSWDLAFLRTGAFNIGIRVNDHAGIEVFEVSDNPSDWNTIQIADQSSWIQLYNSETSWNGAFDNGSASYGFGEYNPVNHHVEGSVIFVLKYTDGTYRKFMNEDVYNGYTFKYATWDAGTTTWSADTTVTLANSNNPNNTYNFYSLVNGAEVVAQPATADWDFVFTKYISDYYGDGSLYWPVTGVLHSDQVSVAQNEETSGMPTVPSLTYSEEINTIGWDWKSYVSSTFNVDPTQAYYIKYEDNSVYRMYFVDFDGSSTGGVSFTFENVTTTLGIEDVTENITFGMYPNPSLDKQVNLVYDVNTLESDKNKVAIYDITGAEVFRTQLSNNSGFYSKRLNLSNLQSGVYMVHFTSGNASITKKLVLK